MFASFFKYFFAYIVRAKTRQRLLFLALFSLFLSSFALVVLQGIMNGLQSSLVDRSKLVYGDLTAYIQDLSPERQERLFQELSDYGLDFFEEVETEVLLRHGAHISPAILHGVKKKPLFLQGKSIDGLVLGADLSRKIQAYYGGEVQVVTPNAMDTLLGDIPRSLTLELTDLVQTDVTEADLLHAWVKDRKVFNLLKKIGHNKIRFYQVRDQREIESVLSKHCPDCVLKTWEQKHQSLKWALDLESRMMLFLFGAMTFLVSISITAGLLIFYDKVKKDFATFWIIGMEKKRIYRVSSYFTYTLNALACVLGLLLGCAFLWFLKEYSQSFIPEVFVERSLPVKITWASIGVSFFLPMGISLLFSMFSVHFILREEGSFLKILRGQE